MNNSPHEFILRYLRLLHRHAFIIEVAMTRTVSEGLLIQIVTPKGCVQIWYKADKQGVHVARKSFSGFSYTRTPLNEVLFYMDYGYQTPKAGYKTFEHKGTDIDTLVSSIGATVVAPSDFQIQSHQKHINQQVKN